MSKYFLVSFISATLFCLARMLVAVCIVVLNSYMYQSIQKLEYVSYIFPILKKISMALKGWVKFSMAMRELTRSSAASSPKKM